MPGVEDLNSQVLSQDLAPDSDGSVDKFSRLDLLLLFVPFAQVFRDEFGAITGVQLQLPLHLEKCLVLGLLLRTSAT